MAGSDGTTMFASLVSWIVQGGGAVHPSLELSEDGNSSSSSSRRGIFCRQAIPKDDLLIRLPAQLVLSGDDSDLPHNRQQHEASPWLRCLAAFYKARGERQKEESLDGMDYTPYLNSLPNTYESVLNWSQAEVSSLLAGTVLGEMLSRDLREGTTQSRYEKAVRPFLKQKGIDSDFNANFLQACACLSTRGFHLHSTSDTSEYTGPFLLPLIDLINHDPQKKCTTLQRDKNGSFYMVAERDIDAGEEVLHSYGNNLSSTQLLQTFGFVTRRASQRIAATFGGSTKQLALSNLSPAVLDVSRVVAACQKIESTGYAKELRQHMHANNMEEDETWHLASLEEMESRANHISSSLLQEKKFVIKSLTDDLVTMCSLLLLPHEVYQEFAKELSLLDKSVLEDYYLGKLVCKALVIAIDNKLNEYSKVTIDSCDGEDDCALLSILLQKEDSLTQYEQRAVYALTVRLEEKACLSAVRTEALQTMGSLDDLEEVTDKKDCSEPKRMRIS